MALEVEGLDDEELADVLYHLGTCYEQLEREEEARACYERVSAVDDEFRKAWKGTRQGGAGAGADVGDMAAEAGEEEGEG